MTRFLLLTTATLALLAGSAPAAPWVRVAGGFSHMAMGDVNGAAFNFYDDPASTARFGDVGTGFVLDLALGHDLSETWGLGFHWDRQWAGTSATDSGVDGKLDLGANFFIARAYWRPLRRPGWNLGLVAGLGPVFTRGDVKVERGSTNYGQHDISGNGWSFDGAVHLGVSLTGKAELQVQGGWRHANIGKFKVNGFEVKQEDDSFVELDYTGWQVKAGVRWVFSEGG